jgi:hypothetical protein
MGRREADGRNEVRLTKSQEVVATQERCSRSVSENPQSTAVGVLEIPLSADAEIISDSALDSMTDPDIVEYAAQRIVKFAVEIRPVLIKVHERFLAEKKAGRPFLGHTNFDKFCLAFWNYTGRQIRNIINGTPTPATRKEAGPGRLRKSNRQAVEEDRERQAEQARQEGIQEGRRIERESFKQAVQSAYERGIRDGANSGLTSESNPTEVTPAESVRHECVLRLSPEERKLVSETLEAMKHYKDTSLSAAPGKVFVLQTDALIVRHPEDGTPSHECYKLAEALVRGNRKQVGQALAKRLEGFARHVDGVWYLAYDISRSAEKAKSLLADSAISASWPSLRRIQATLHQAHREMGFVAPPSEA